MKTPGYIDRTMVLSVLAIGVAAASSAQTFTVVKRFNGTNGEAPSAPLVQGVDGNLYGTTEAGGAHQNGTVYRLTPAGKLTVLHSFCISTGCPDGASPISALVQGIDDFFYGTTWVGGTHSIGSLFQIRPSRKFTSLYSFCAVTNCPDGAQIQSPLIQGNDGFFYGTALDGGANGNDGTVFRYQYGRGGGLTTIHSFCAFTNCADGSNPRSGLIQGTDGNFYGTTETSGANGRGTIFKITPAGSVTVLYSFCVSSGCPDGASPSTPVVQATDGNFYGVTPLGGFVATGCSSGCGTFFKLTPTGTLTTLYRFSFTDGAFPVGLIQATDGNFYGTTEQGGSRKAGTLFKVTPTGVLTTLHTLSPSEGKDAQAGLMQSTDGTFYGTGAFGGSGNHGTIFRLSTGIAPFVETLPRANTQGLGVQIQGYNLSGTTSVTFNGVSAKFVVVSDTLIDSAVPAGATTGTVQVVTPAGTLSSNVAFQVLP